eukprot:336837-Amphidinium_carterae.2
MFSLLDRNFDGEVPCAAIQPLQRCALLYSTCCITCKGHTARLPETCRFQRRGRVEALDLVCIVHKGQTTFADLIEGVSSFAQL